MVTEQRVRPLDKNSSPTLTGADQKAFEKNSYGEFQMLLDIKKLTAITSLSQSLIYKLIAENKFPKPVKIGRASRWRDSDIQDYIANL